MQMSPKLRYVLQRKSDRRYFDGYNWAMSILSAYKYTTSDEAGMIGRQRAPNNWSVLAVST